MGLGLRLLIILFSISIALSLSGFVIDDSDNVPKYFGFDYNYSNGTMNSSDINASQSGIIVNSNVTGISAGGISFFDRFENVVGWLEGVADFFTAPIGVLRSQHAPDSVIFAVGTIWTMLWAIAIISFIWRKDF